MSAAVVLKLALFFLGIVLGAAYRRQADHLRGWDEGFQFGRLHGRELARRELADRGRASTCESIRVWPAP